MIPITLQLKNFLSYGPQLQTIEFGPHPLICLSGKNGHGKSALLDAITWAIWGQARKVSTASKADEGLLRLGQTHMQVILDFAFHNRHYRVRREFSLSMGKSTAHLDFGIIDADTKQVIPLTDKTIRATQEKIETTIGLDYDSFVNSAFLRQGNSNEFSHKSPKERKEILASILGLAQYEELRKRALEQGKKHQEEQLLLEAKKGQLVQTLGTSGDIVAQQATVEEQLRDIEQKAEIVRARVQQLQAISLIQMQIESQQQQSQQYREKIRATRQQWKLIHHKQLQMPDIAELETIRASVAQQHQAQQKILQQQLALKEQLYASKDQEQQYRTKLHQQFMALQTAQMTMQQLTAQQKQIVGELGQIAQAKAQFDVQLRKLSEIEQQFERRKTYYQRYIAWGNLLSSQKNSFASKQSLTETDDPSCPLCEQNLSAARKRFLKAKFSQEERFLIHRLAKLTQVIAQLKAALTEQHEQRQKLLTLSQQREMLELKAKELSATEQRITTQVLELAAQVQGQAVGSFEAWLEQHAEYQQIRSVVVAAEKQLLTISFDMAAFQALSQRLATLDQTLREHQELKQELFKQGQRREQVRDCGSQLRSIQHEQLKLMEKIKGLGIDPAQLPQLQLESIACERQNRELGQQKEAVLQEKGRLAAASQQLESIGKEIPVIEKQIAQSVQELEEYQAIAGALGKDGIQALLIEEAIPEIEQEANRLLSKLTENQAQLLIDSIRDLKKGGTRETLDIKISDALGIRPYELFSGGEAFRIDFALRIAIAKLLARRAGTSLQTLIIDEGFGSQDEEGLGHIMDALYKIQDDFAKIIIVSHLPSMKDQFPVHFVIEKGAHGSRVSTITQG